MCFTKIKRVCTLSVDPSIRKYVHMLHEVIPRLLVLRQLSQVHNLPIITVVVSNHTNEHKKFKLYKGTSHRSDFIFPH